MAGQRMGASCRYKKNEVFLDVVESVNLLVNSNGTVVRSEVVGALKMRTFLSGMPECKLGLNDKVRALHDFLSCTCRGLHAGKAHLMHSNSAHHFRGDKFTIAMAGRLPRQSSAQRL